MKKIMKWTGIVLGGLVGLALLAGAALYPLGMRKLTKSYPDSPVEAVSIPTDPAAVARGRHIAVIWGCTQCHGENLSGMLLTDDPILGTIPASNLTSGKGGIGESYTDTGWIRAIRHGIKPNKRSEAFMYDFSTMSDQDLGDLIAYLKQVSPVDTDYPALRFGPVIPLAPALGMYVPAAELIDHSEMHPASPAPGATISYGEYLSAVCYECHGTSLAGKLDGWRQEDFIRAIQTGILPDGRQLGPAMPLQPYIEMNDMETSALWLYLQSSQAVVSQK